MKKLFSDKRNFIDLIRFLIIASFLFYAAWTGFYPKSFTYDFIDETKVYVYEGMFQDNVYLFNTSTGDADQTFDVHLLLNKIDSLRTSALTFVSILLISVERWFSWQRGERSENTNEKNTKRQKYKKRLGFIVSLISFIILATIHLSIVDDIIELLE
ncbi:hypothetical protein [Evansella halocellulosilytica]|uniref:hypothetical protein n=1 Tax=Evansella halocellulosilytica TaxID=2011013 RepID=UPI000BB76E41|nr:hypothetical protein [Evansella halocellulosilytica]